MLGLFNSFIKKGERDDRNTDSIYRKEHQQIERRKKEDKKQQQDNNKSEKSKNHSEEVEYKFPDGTVKVSDGWIVE